MCSVCMSSPCLPSCPNAPEPKTSIRCGICDTGLTEDEEYIEAPDGSIICDVCLDDMTTDDLLEALDIQKRRVAVDR